MASFAKLDNNNIVTTVVSVVNKVLKDSNGIEQEQLGIDFLKILYNEPNSIWKQTSYNTHGNVHSLGGTPFRKNHAGIGYTYDSNRDAFILPKPFNSWILNESTCNWEAPTAYPNDGKRYNWNEETQSWILAPIPPKPYNSWLLNEQTRYWEAPIAYPNDGQRYSWNEENQSWTLQNI